MKSVGAGGIGLGGWVFGGGRGASAEHAVLSAVWRSDSEALGRWFPGSRAGKGDAISALVEGCKIAALTRTAPGGPRAPLLRRSPAHARFV
jgi:hypothetical protein